MKLIALLVLSPCVFILQSCKSGPVKPAAIASVDYSYKGDRVGMSFVDFKGKVNAFNCKKLAAIYADGELSQNESIIRCAISESGRSSDVGKLLNFRLDDLIYNFYAGKLYQIDVSFPSSYYDDVRSALITKYGKPFVDADGVSGKENVTWAHAGQSLSLDQRDENGAEATTPYMLSHLMYFNTELEPPDQMRNPPDQKTADF